MFIFWVANHLCNIPYLTNYSKIKIVETNGFFFFLFLKQFYVQEKWIKSSLQTEIKE